MSTPQNTKLDRGALDAEDKAAAATSNPFEDGMWKLLRENERWIQPGAAEE